LMIDNLMANLARIDSGEFVPPESLRAFCGGRRYAVLTLHRPANVDRRETLESIWGAISEIARHIPILFPVHPRTRLKLDAFDLDGNNITMINPIGYLDMLYATRNATLVLTDSGGLQEETTILGVPCMTIRENTERPVTIDMGTNYLVGSDPSLILAVACEILAERGKKGVAPPYWDGKAAERIAEVFITIAKCE